MLNNILQGVVLPIVVAVISGIFTKWVKGMLLSLRTRELNKLNVFVEDIEKMQLITDEKFHNEFVLPALRELRFYIQTGIRTNEKSIDNYIKFKDKLKENYDWKSIGQALSYLKFDDQNEINVSISKTDIFFKNIELIISLCFFLFAIFLIFIFNYYVDHTDVEQIILMFIMFCSSVFFVSTLDFLYSEK